MKAATYSAYGRSDVLCVGQMDEPSPRRGQVLIRVRAAALNPKDVLVRAGKFRLLTGFKFPRQVGYDWAGEVVAQGPGVSWPPLGSRAFGMIDAWSAGACAEFVAANVAELGLAPQHLSFEECAALPLASLTSLQALRNVAGVRAGDHLTIHGASGGVGLLAIPIAKKLGAHVTTISSQANLELCRSRGADLALDYRSDAIVDSGRRCDVFFDVFGNQSLAKVRPMLGRQGTYVSTVPKWHVFQGWLTTLWARQRCRLVMVRSRALDLKLLASWAEEGGWRPVIDSTFALDDIRAAQQRVETRHAHGKVVILIG